MIVLGIDPATTWGWAVLDSNGWKHLDSGIKSTALIRDICGAAGRWTNIWNVLDSLYDRWSFEVVCYEYVARPAAVLWAYQYAGFVATIQLWCRMHSPQLKSVGIPVQIGKKALTGKGNATKEMSVLHAEQRFDIVCATHDQADAIGVALGYGLVAQ